MRIRPVEKMTIEQYDVNERERLKRLEREFDDTFLTKEEVERIDRLNVWTMRFHIKNCQDCQKPYVQENKEQKVCRFCVYKLLNK